MNALVKFLCFIFFLAFAFFVIQMVADDPLLDGNDTFSIRIFHHQITLDFGQ